MRGQQARSHAVHDAEILAGGGGRVSRRVRVASPCARGHGSHRHRCKPLHPDLGGPPPATPLSQDLATRRAPRTVCLPIWRCSGVMSCRLNSRRAVSMCTSRPSVKAAVMMGSWGKGRGRTAWYGNVFAWETCGVHYGMTGGSLCHCQGGPTGAADAAAEGPCMWGNVRPAGALRRLVGEQVAQDGGQQHAGACCLAAPVPTSSSVRCSSPSYTPDTPGSFSTAAVDERKTSSSPSNFKHARKPPAHPPP